MSEHEELVRRAVRWLRGKHSCAVVFAEMTSAVSETPDVIGWHRTVSHVVECKVSRSDFLRDRMKMHARAEESMGHFRWYLTPPGIVRAEEIEGRYGLAELHGSRIVVRAEAPMREGRAWQNEIRLLVSAVQRAHLGTAFDHETARWESYAARTARTAEART